MLGEFGRTPKISGSRAKAAGRDHWASCFFGLFAGAGVRGGQVIGKSDKIGAYPATTPYSPDDVGATVYHVLGVDPAVRGARPPGPAGAAEPRPGDGGAVHRRGGIEVHL